MGIELHSVGSAPGLRLTQRIRQIPWSLVILITMVASMGFVMLYSAAGGSPEPWMDRQMVRYAVGYRSRAFVTFGAPIPTASCNTQSSTEVLELTRTVRDRIGRQYKVLPTALVAAALRRSMSRRELEARVDDLIGDLSAVRANLGATSGRQAVEAAAEPLESRGIIVQERGRFRVRQRSVLRYYARTIEHLTAVPGVTH